MKISFFEGISRFPYPETKRDTPKICTQRAPKSPTHARCSQETLTQPRDNNTTCLRVGPRSSPPCASLNEDVRRAPPPTRPGNGSEARSFLLGSRCSGSSERQCTGRDRRSSRSGSHRAADAAATRDPVAASTSSRARRANTRIRMMKFTALKASSRISRLSDG